MTDSNINASKYSESANLR